MSANPNTPPATPHAVTERPIPFSGPLIRALLDGRKTQTRRLVKPQPPTPLKGQYFGFHPAPAEWGKPRLFTVTGDVWAVRERDKKIANEGIRCPYGAPGDRLWVRETWRPDPFGGVYYRATGVQAGVMDYGWKPSIHMPRRASRITLQIESVRVERLQDAKLADLRAEGMSSQDYEKCLASFTGAEYQRTWWRDLWDSVNGEHSSYDSNPWVWVLEFHVANIVERAA